MPFFHFIQIQRVGGISFILRFLGELQPVTLMGVKVKLEDNRMLAQRPFSLNPAFRSRIEIRQRQFVREVPLETV